MDEQKFHNREESKDYQTKKAGIQKTEAYVESNLKP
jgi:hypothetical protein